MGGAHAGRAPPLDPPMDTSYTDSTWRALWLTLIGPFHRKQGY